MSARRKITIRIRSETDAWLERRAGGSKNKAGFLRELIEREMAREKEAELLTLFNEAAAETRIATEREASLKAMKDLAADVARSWTSPKGAVELLSEQRR